MAAWCKVGQHHSKKYNFKNTRQQPFASLVVLEDCRNLEELQVNVDIDKNLGMMKG